MCGIAGWVDFSRNLLDEQETVSAMAETMTLRGPDDAGTWSSPEVVLCHRRLAVIDIAGGRQPMQTEGLAVLTYSGEVYNFRELRSELESRDYRFTTSSDTEVVLRGYLEWGDGVAERLNGMFAFAVWDVRKKEIVLVRDRMGVKPLFYYLLPEGGVIFGSEPKAILANPLADRAVGADGLREILTITQTPGISLYKGMRELTPGHVLRVGRAGASLRRYWQLEAREHSDDVPTTVGTVRGLLEDIVERQLVADVPLCTLLSGGLDSTAVTALAGKHQRIRSFSVDFTDLAGTFKPDEMRESADAPYVAEAAAYLGSDHTDLPMDVAGISDQKVRARVVGAWEYPQFSGDMNTSLYLLFQAIKGHSTVALSGEAADEVFGGYAWFHLPAAVNAGTFPWLYVMMRKQRPDDLFDPALRKQLDVVAYEQDRYLDALREVPHLPHAEPRERRMREVSYLHLTRFVNMLLDRKDRLSMAHGLEVRVPFCDHRLVLTRLGRSKRSTGGREACCGPPPGICCPRACLPAPRAPIRPRRIRCTPGHCAVPWPRFDDGYADLLDDAVPALAERGVQAPFFLCTDTLGHRSADPRQNYLSWPEVADLAVIRPFYAVRRALAEKLLLDAMPASVDWRLHSNEGGMFAWLWVNEDWFDDLALYRDLKARGVFITPGRSFFTAPPRPAHHSSQCFRITLSVEEEVLREGIKRIGLAVGQASRQPMGPS